MNTNRHGDEILSHESLLLLKDYAPTLYECACRSKRAARSVADKYDLRWREMDKSIRLNGVFCADTCIFDLLWHAGENNKDNCIEFLSFIDSTVKRVINATRGQLRNRLEEVVVRMIISFGEKSCEYSNLFAEIAVIEKLIAGRNCELIAVEKRLPNGKSIDFEITLDGDAHLIEVYSINFDIDKLSDSQDLKNFLDKRLLDKFKTKLDGLQKEDCDCLLIVPVLWGDIVSLVKFVDAFKYFKDISVVAPFMMIGRYVHQFSSEVIYDFNTVEHFLDRVMRRNKGIV